ncbi:MAG: fatty acyl-CoA reductase [Candidatus Latescibacteria bacterium]|nr:fatty acyl-CoA reductase [Candidatus Latescibacterota bacterium]
MSVSAMIREFYQDRTVLLTGGTGFYGQGLTAKILRYLPGVRRLYLVLRPGRGPGGAMLPVEERLDELFKLVVFDRFRQEEPAAFATARQKVRALACDMRQPGLGLDEASRDELLEEVDLIIGNAASVTFDEPLDSAIQFNTLAPQELLRLAREGRKNPVLVHVSTAYVNGRLTGAVSEQTLPVDRTIQHLIDGSAPPQPFVPEKEIDQAQARCQAIRDQAQSDEQQQAFRREIVEQSHRRTLSDSRLQKLIDDRCRRWIERELVDEGMRRARQHGWNDVYTFTKAMGEQLLVKNRGQVPLAIVRPSVTEGALQDPHPGWIHGLKVTDPLIVAYGRGIVPDFPAAMGAPMDLVPVDIVVNTVLAATTQATASTVEVFHAATSGENPLPNTRMFQYVKGYFEEHPLLNKDGSRPELVDWTFPTVEQFQRVFNWKYLYPLELKQKLYECLPERWAPAQKKRRLAALKTRLKRVQYFIDLFSPYTTLDCRYETKRMLALYESLPPEEQRIFNMDVRRIDWYQYYQTAPRVGWGRRRPRAVERGTERSGGRRTALAHRGKHPHDPGPVALGRRPLRRQDGLANRAPVRLDADQLRRVAHSRRVRGARLASTGRVGWCAGSAVRGQRAGVGRRLYGGQPAWASGRAHRSTDARGRHLEAVRLCPSAGADCYGKALFPTLARGRGRPQGNGLFQYRSRWPAIRAHSRTRRTC